MEWKRNLQGKVGHSEIVSGKEGIKRREKYY